MTDAVLSDGNRFLLALLSDSNRFLLALLSDSNRFYLERSAMVIASTCNAQRW